MALSLWDHERRLRDLEAALHVVLEISNPQNQRKAILEEAARRLKIRGEDGAAALLLSPKERAYAR